MTYAPVPYPGGKARVSGDLMRRRPLVIDEYREPFAGGAAILLAMRSRDTGMPCWLNDADLRVVTFWRVLQEQPDKLIQRLLRLCVKHQGGSRDLFEFGEAALEGDDAMDVAVGFYLHFLLGRGNTSGWYYSPERVAQGKAMTTTKIMRLPRVSSLLRGVRITCLDYREALSGCRANSFTFLDPPYEGIGSDLYWKGEPDFKGLADVLREQPGNWLMTINDGPTIRELFKGRHIEPLRLRYSGFGNRHGEELIISNYAAPYALGDCDAA
jgi:DNA adenine methylase